MERINECAMADEKSWFRFVEDWEVADFGRKMIIECRGWSTRRKFEKEGKREGCQINITSSPRT